MCAPTKILEMIRTEVIRYPKITRSWYLGRDITGQELIHMKIRIAKAPVAMRT